MTTVFISYSHDSDAHRDFVRGVADRLRGDGVDCKLDQYINGFPPEGWQHWMESQIEEADFVLLVCTETYLRRYRGQETEGGKGVNFEGVVISQTLYDHYYQNIKFIPIIPEDGSFDHVPLPLKPYSTYRLNSQYENVYRILTRQAEYVQPPLGEVRQLPTLQSSRKIISDDLPTVEGELFGRKDELALLNDALDGISPHPNPSPQGRGARPHIVQFVASGGTGKTKLIRHWLDENSDKIEALIAWSFYSQGSGEDKQISATPFFMQTLKSLGSDKSVSDFHTEEEKGEYIADLLREKRCLLVLDGLEPLQQVGRGMRGELKDRAIRKMLGCLVGDHSSLCIITTRLPVHELKGRRQVVQHDLQNLAPEDGVALLRSSGVSGRDVDMLAAVEEYGCHALALHLLSNALATYLDGDVRKRDMLTELMGDYDDVERHAFKVMQAYEHWLAGTPELKLLYLLGLFDHPVEQEVLEVLWEAEIPGLTEGVERKAWLVARRNLLDKFRMMSEHEGQNDLFDCHPLIREYFGWQLKENQEGVWWQAHTVLYEYYKGLPEKLWGKYLPDTLEEMWPLFRAVSHGCKAELYQETFYEVYWPCIRREKEQYLTAILGSFAEDLILVSYFFSKVWWKPNESLSEEKKGYFLNAAGYNLTLLGRLVEARQPMEAATKTFKSAHEWVNLSISTSNFSELQLTLGDISLAVRNSAYGIGYAKKTKYLHWRIFAWSSHARNLIYQGDFSGAKKALRYARWLCAWKFLSIPQISYSRQGFPYYELMLLQNNENKVIKLALRAISLAQIDNRFSDIAMYQLIIGRAYFQLGNTLQANDWLEQSIDGLKSAQSPSDLSSGLLVYAALHRQNNDVVRAGRDLMEVYEIAEPSGMRLHLTDYHLEMARLILALETDPTQYPEATPDREQRILPFADQDEPGILTLEGHIAEAARLIKETGYHRRDAELAELQKVIEVQ